MPSAPKSLASNQPQLSDDDCRLMRRALTLARRGQGRVEPNPMVGCVIAQPPLGQDRRSAGEIIGEGWHRKFGGPHAEIEALRDCQARGFSPAGAHAFVTLEPCNHQGKTPPCTNALIEARLARVVVAVADPNPEIAPDGQSGLSRLRQAGLAVQLASEEDAAVSGSGGELAAQARQLNGPFFKRIRTGMPWVIVKWAQTLDGCIATATGESKWISSAASRRYVHRIRARVDAVLTGIGTVLADDPMLTARGVPRKRHAMRVVIDPGLRLPMDCKLVRSLAHDPPGPPVIIAISRPAMHQHIDKVKALRKLGVCVASLPPWRKPTSIAKPKTDEHELEAALPQQSSLPIESDAPATQVNRLNLAVLLRRLARGDAKPGAPRATNVLVEAGPRLNGSLFEQNLVDQVITFIAPRLLGDPAGIAPISGAACPQISSAARLHLTHWRRIENDLCLEYRTHPDPHK